MPNTLYTPPFYPTRGYTGNFPIGNVDAGNYSYFQPDGFQFAVGAARGYYDFNIAGAEMGAGASAPDLVAINGGTIQYRAFDGNAITEQLFAGFEMNHNWAEGTPAGPHAHLNFTNAAAGNVKFFLTYTFDVEDSVDPVETTISAIVAAPGVQWANKYIIFPEIALPTIKIGSQFSCRIYRVPTDPQDTYGFDVILKTFGLHVLVNSLGSRQLSTK